ncbi:helix-turn-helix domain-containing protein [Nonomuraea angiospora]
MSDRSTAGRIVDVARRILVEERAEAVSMRRVGDAVGVTAMAIYRHFPSRDALLRAAAWTGRVSSGGLEERMAAAMRITSSAQGLVQQYLSGRIGMDEADFRALCHRSTGRIIRGVAAE